MPARAVKQPDLAPDLPAIRKFLNHLNRDWFHLVAIDPSSADKRTYGYVADGPEDACDWICQQQARGWNVYWAVNAPHYRQSKKASRGELRTLYAIHADLDLPADLDRQSPKAEALIKAMIEKARDGGHILEGQPMVVMSGNGVQAVWFLDEPLKATPDNMAALETINRRVLKHFGRTNGSEWDATRVLRVPGSVNFPSAIKLKRNCVPMLSRLLCVSDRDFCLSDFGRLPKVEAVTERDRKTEYKDYTQHRYKNWNPYNWHDVVKFLPQLPNEVVRKYTDDETAGDRSTASFTLIRGVLEFFVHELDQQVKDFMDDTDVKRNILEICLEAGDASADIGLCIERYFERDEPLVHFGADISRCLMSAAQQGVGPSVRREAKARAAQEAAAINAAPEDAVTVLDATKAFLVWVSSSVPRDHLPNRVMTNMGPAPRQPTTLANVRHALVKSGITARWDAMRDEARFIVDPNEGLGGATPHRPAFNWERALSRTIGRQRENAEFALLSDALCELGMEDRRKIEMFLARIAMENSFHPLEDYCQMVAWDGADRIERLVDVLDTEHPLARRYLEIFLYQGIAAVKSLRHFQRTGIGLQLSATPVLVGPQGIGKSTFWQKLAPPGMLARGRALQIGTHKEADSLAACLSGLICQLSEIGATMRRSEADAFKDFQSGTVDTYRVSYSPTTVTKGRMTIFAGDANPDFQLMDPTGSRRYLVLTVRKIFWDLLAAVTEAGELQQLWAQAWHMVMVCGESWTLTAEEDHIRALENDPHNSVSAEEAAVDAYLSTVTKIHQLEWLNYSQLCTLLGLNYQPRLSHGLRAALHSHGHEYRHEVKDGLRTYRKVFRVPVTPERMAELRTLRYKA